MNWHRLIDSLLFGLIVGTVYTVLDKKGFEAHKGETA
jgi:hypothetical protein